MGQRRLGNILVDTWLGLVVFLAFITHSGSDLSDPQLHITLNSGQRIKLTLPQDVFRNITDCLCNGHLSSYCFIRASYTYGLKGLPSTITGDLHDLSNWHITVSRKLYEGCRKMYYRLSRHSSKVPDFKCWNKEDRQILKENLMCSFKPQSVYLGGSRWLVIDDNAEVVTFKYNDNDDDCKDGNVGCTGDCSTTSVPPPADSTENMDKTETDNTENAAKQESSSDQTHVIAGVVIAVLIVLSLLAILAMILWRRWKSKPREANPTFAAHNPGAYAGENARNEAVQNWDQQNVSTLGLPPSYDQVVSGQHDSNQQGFTNNTYFALFADDLH